MLEEKGSVVRRTSLSLEQQLWHMLVLMLLTLPQTPRALEVIAESLTGLGTFFTCNPHFQYH